jgi:hypothetical protein
MTIFTFGKRVYVCCEGCGNIVVAQGDWWLGKDYVDEVGWYTIPTDYGCPDGPAWEHFCCTACLDPPEWRM